MSDKIEEEARKLSEEMNLPLEYVKQMLEYMEQTLSDTTESPFSDFTDNSPRPPFTTIRAR